MKTKKELILEQVRLQKNANINTVSCGNCGAAFHHERDAEEVQCFSCEEIMDPCDCPDLFYRGMEDELVSIDTIIDPIPDIVDRGIHDIFLQANIAVGNKSGDVSPEQDFAIEQVKGNLRAIINEVLEMNKPKTSYSSDTERTMALLIFMGKEPSKVFLKDEWGWADGIFISMTNPDKNRILESVTYYLKSNKNAWGILLDAWKKINSMSDEDEELLYNFTLSPGVCTVTCNITGKELVACDNGSTIEEVVYYTITDFIFWLTKNGKL